MSAILSISESVILTDLRAFLLNFLSEGTEVIKAQTNRVPEPKAPDFVMMTPTRRARLATNIDSFADCVFSGVINSAGILTVTGIVGKMTIGARVFGQTLPVDGVAVVKQLTGTPLGNGSYQMATGTGAAAAGPMANGVTIAKQETQISVQLDVHGPNGADNSQIITTLFRDEVATAFFTAAGHGVSPLYADEAKQLPFVNEGQQIEDRWVIGAELQANPNVITPQQFAQVLTVGLIEVDATYPP